MIIRTKIQCPCKESSTLLVFMFGALTVGRREAAKIDGQGGSRKWPHVRPQAATRSVQSTGLHIRFYILD